MARPDLIITICGDKQRASGVNPPTDKAQQIKRAFIRPMDVFKDGEGGPGLTSELSQEGVEHRFPSPAVLELALELAADSSRDVSHWTQRARCRERIAHAFQNPRTDSSRARNCRTSADLPTPASPPTNASRPCPAAASPRNVPS
jgi:hypothetical protein